MTTTTGAGAPAAAGAAVPARRAVSGASPASGVFVTSGAPAACGAPTASSGACAVSGSSGASGGSGTGRAARPRADALRNRERIVAAAREMLVESGADAPLDEIARRAGVGNATVYRHFPDRTTLVHEVVVSVMARIADSAERAAAEEPEPFAAVRRFTHEAADERIGALCPMLSGVFEPDEPCVAAARDRLETAVLGLFERAQTAGRMRADVAVGDLLVALSQLTRPLPGIACPVNDQFVHRHLQLLLDGLEAPGRSELPGAPATLAGLRRPGAPESRESAESAEGPQGSEGSEGPGDLQGSESPERQSRH